MVLTPCYVIVPQIKQAERTRDLTARMLHLLIYDSLLEVQKKTFNKVPMQACLSWGKKIFKYHMSLLNRHTEASLMQSVPLFLIWKPSKSLHAVVSLLLQRILITLNQGSHFQVMQCAGTCTLPLFLIESSCSRAESLIHCPVWPI